MRPTQVWYRRMHHQLGITRVSLLLAPTPSPRASPTRPNVGGGRHAITYYHYCGIVPPPSRGERPSSRDTPIHVRLTLGVGSCPPVVVLLHRLLRNLEHIRVNARATRKNAKQRRNEIRNTKRRRRTGTHRQPNDVRRQRRTRRNDKHRPQTRRVRIARLALERVGEGFDEAERVPDGGDDLCLFFDFNLVCVVFGCWVYVVVAFRFWVRDDLDLGRRAGKHHTPTTKAHAVPFQRQAHEYGDAAQCRGAIGTQQRRWQRQMFVLYARHVSTRLPRGSTYHRQSKTHRAL